MGVAFTIDFALISESQVLAPIFAESLGLEALAGSALRDAILSRTKGKTGPEKRDVFLAATKPTHVQFINPDDAATSEPCRAILDSTHTWIIGDSDIQLPPIHWGCRSSLAFIKLDGSGKIDALPKTISEAETVRTEPKPKPPAPKKAAPAKTADKKKIESLDKQLTASKKATKKEAKQGKAKTDDLRRKLDAQREATKKATADLEKQKKRTEDARKELANFNKQREEIRKLKAEAEKLQRSVKRSKTLDSINPDVQKAKKEILDSTSDIIKRANDIL